MRHEFDDDDHDFSELKGRTLTACEVRQDDEIVFTCDDGAVYVLSHDQDCCERVEVDSIDGDLTDLLGSPLVMAEEVASEGPQLAEEDHSGSDRISWSWTFYKLATVHGYVTIKFYGSSNGCYSEKAELGKLVAK